MRLPMPAAAIARISQYPVGTMPADVTTAGIMPAGVVPPQCQCTRVQRNNRSMYVVDERSSNCPANTVATCDQANGACACNAIVPVVRPRYIGYDYR